MFENKINSYYAVNTLKEFLDNGFYTAHEKKQLRQIPRIVQAILIRKL